MKDFSLAINKNAARKVVLSKFNTKKVIGLAGPNFKEYVTLFNSLGYTSIDAWEFDRDIFTYQLSQVRDIKNIPFSLTFGDILQAPNYVRDVLYDLDFCNGITNFRKHVARFNYNSIFTFALRPYGTLVTFEIFAQAKGEIIQDFDERSCLVTTDNNMYEYLRYRDTNGAPMIIIYPYYKNI